MIAYLIKLARRFLIKVQYFLEQKEFFLFGEDLSTTFVYPLQPEGSVLLVNFLWAEVSSTLVILLRGHQLLPHSMTL